MNPRKRIYMKHYMREWRFKNRSGFAKALKAFAYVSTLMKEEAK